MANHVRQQIREAAAALLTGLNTTGDNVFQSRVKAYANDELPCLVVLTNSETVISELIGENPLQTRAIDLVIIAKAKQTADLDDKLDTIIKEVEMAFNATIEANTLVGLVDGLLLQSVEIELNGDGEKPVGEATMTFNATYRTRAAAPDVSL